MHKKHNNNAAAARKIQGWWLRLGLRAAASNYVLYGAGHELLASGQMQLGQVLDTVVHDPQVLACTQRLVLLLLVVGQQEQEEELRGFVQASAEALGLAHFFAYEPRCDATTPMFDTTHHHALMAASRAFVAALRSLAGGGGGMAPPPLIGECLRRYMEAYRAWLQDANPIHVIVGPPQPLVVVVLDSNKKAELRRELLGQYATLANLGLFVPDQIRPLRLRLQTELDDEAWLQTLDLDRGFGQLERHLALANGSFSCLADIHVLPVSVTKLTCEVLLNPGFTPRLLPVGAQRKQHIGYIAWDGEGVDLVPLADCIERPNAFWRRMASADGRAAALKELLDWIPRSLRLAGMPRDEALAQLEARLLVPSTTTTTTNKNNEDEADTLAWCMRWVLARTQQQQQPPEVEPRDWAAGLTHLRMRGGGASGVAVAVMLSLLRTVDTLRLRCLTRRVRAMACPAQAPFLWAFLGKQAEAELGMAAADGASALSHEGAVRELTDAYRQMLAMPVPIPMNGSVERYVTEVALVDTLLLMAPKEPSVLFYGFGHALARLRETLDRLTRVAIVMRAFKLTMAHNNNGNNDASSRLCSELWRVLLPTLQVQTPPPAVESTTTTTTTTTLAFGRACLTAVAPLLVVGSNDASMATMTWVRIEASLRHHLVFGKNEEAHHHQLLRLMREAAVGPEEARSTMEQHLVSVIKANIGYGEQQVSVPLVMQSLIAPPAYRMLRPLARDLTRLVWHLARLSQVYHDIHGTRNAAWLHQFVFGGRF